MMTQIMSSEGFLAKLEFSSEIFGKWGIRVECTVTSLMSENILYLSGENSDNSWKIFIIIINDYYCDNTPTDEWKQLLILIYFCYCSLATTNNQTERMHS